MSSKIHIAETVTSVVTKKIKEQSLLFIMVLMMCAYFYVELEKVKDKLDACETYRIYLLESNIINKSNQIK